MKIGAKLITSFVAVALIAGIVGVQGISNIQKIDKKDTELYEYMTVPIEIMGTVSTEFASIRFDTRDLISATSPADIDKYEKNILDRRAKIASSLEEFEKTIQSSEVRDIYNIIMSSSEGYDKVLDQLIEMAKDNKDDEANALLRSDEMIKYAQSEDFAIVNITDRKVADAKLKADANTATAKTALVQTLCLLFGGMLVAAILGVVMSSRISKPIKKLVVVAEKIADGDLDVNVDEGSKDETGVLARAFRKMSDRLNELMTDINSAAEQVASGSKQVSDSSIALSQGATEQASSIEQLTASIEEISSQTKLNADNANRANELSVTAKTKAVQGNDQMAAMKKAMEEINDSSSNISKVIKVIDDIAFQTNILALNAAVEAARAGEYGRGFAVVAEEVRNLAAKSADAAKETTAMIEGSIKKAEAGTKIANETAVALNEIVGEVDKVATLVESIAVASKEQSLGIEQVNQGVMQVSQVVQTNSATSEESAAASEELSGQAELLKTQVSTFKLKKQARTVATYNTVYDNDPDDLKMIQSTKGNKNPDYHNQSVSSVRSSGTKHIILSDSELGKY